jgi:hypothetical protein
VYKRQGIFIATAIGLIANNFIKVSLHTMGVGGLFTAVMIVGFHYPIDNAVWALMVILITGLVVSARMLVSDHTRQELIAGLLIGFLTQVMAYFWVV